MTQTQTDFNATYQRIVDLLEQEEDTVTSFVDIAKREARREQIRQEIHALSGMITALSMRCRQLPLLPPLDVVEWAQAVLDMPNLSFVVLETTGVNDDADILRVLVANRHGNATFFDRIVRPGRFLDANTAYTGLTHEQISEAAPLEDQWDEIQRVLTGRYVLAFNLQFVSDRLAENAKHYALSPIRLIGEDLQEKCRRYWGGYSSPKLATLCEKIAYSLPTPAIAPDRAIAQHALLHAMAQGITSGKQEKPTGELEGDGYEDGPF